MLEHGGFLFQNYSKQRLDNENHPQRAETTRCPGKQRPSHADLNSEMRRDIHAISGVASLERLRRLHHTCPRSSFRGVQRRHCEAMSLTLQRTKQQKGVTSERPVQQRPGNLAGTGSGIISKTAPPISPQTALPDCVTSCDVTRPSLPDLPILSRKLPLRHTSGISEQGAVGLAVKEGGAAAQMTNKSSAWAGCAGR